MTDFFKIDDKIKAASEKALEKAKSQFEIIDDITEYNQHKVISAFIEYGVSELSLIHISEPTRH